jgi:hypothetical protein
MRHDTEELCGVALHILKFDQIEQNLVPTIGRMSEGQVHIRWHDINISRWLHLIWNLSSFCLGSLGRDGVVAPSHLILKTETELIQGVGFQTKDREDHLATLWFLWKRCQSVSEEGQSVSQSVSQ